MIPSVCSLLDDYLAHDLSGAELARFIAHLSDCPDCQQIVREHARLDSVLTAAIASLQMVPTGLTDCVARRLRSSHRRRIAFVAAAAAAVVAMIWAISRIIPSADHPLLAEQSVVGPEPPAPELTTPGEEVRVTFLNRDGVLAVPEKSAAPNVTFIRVYPGLRKSPRFEPNEDDIPSPPKRNDP
jgi:hypothetical protein